MTYQTFRFIVLIGAVFVSGASQGMLLPLISIILEDQGVSSALNGLNTSGLYIGILLASPFIERPMQRFGYKPILIIGLSFVMVSLLLFPTWDNFWFWLVLRMIIGVGDNMMHFAAQVWITVTSPPERKGRHIAFYGLAFGSGFAVGPLLSRLLEINQAIPFFIAGMSCLLFVIPMFFLKNDHPDHYIHSPGQSNKTLLRYVKVIELGWIALITAFAYGFLEASLNGNFPVFALRKGLTVNEISILLPAFVVGSLITQIPLGNLSDRYNRKKLLTILTFIGSLTFASAIFFNASYIGLFMIFLISGMTIGSLFSMGMTYLSDLLPKSLLPVGNILAGIGFGIGSMIGPFIGGFMINLAPNGGPLYSISFVMFITFLSLTFKPLKRQTNIENE